MTAVSGARFGPYEILAPLGKGGMGEVYRAKDTRLGREVAIKVLPEAFACDPDRVARFRREAQLLASFNHPNIAAIYEFDEAKGTLFLVMELVPGQTLKQMLLERPLSVGEALPVACQIAEALEAAHAKGVLHRDLKPANVKVTPEKKVKLLDFGLAKAFYPVTPSLDPSQSPTVPAEQTQQGMVIGTAAYMSPEQARGKTLDERSDVWSFGCVLFEILSGQKAFGGDTLSDILVAVLERPPDWDALPPETPPAIVELLKLALKKNVNERLENIADARSVIEGILTGGTPVVARPRTSTQPVSRSLAERPGRLLMLTALLALAGVAAWVGLKSRDGRGSLPKEKYLVVLPFKDLTGQAEGKLMGAGMAEHLSAVLARAPGVLVMPATTGSAPASEGDLQRLAQERGANLFIRASVQREGERMRVAYSLLSSASQAQLDGAVVEGSASDVFGLEDRLAEKVLASLRVRATEPSPPTSHPGLERPEQQVQYLQALGALQRYDDPKSLESAIDLLSKLPGGHDSALVQAALGRALPACSSCPPPQESRRQARATCSSSRRSAART
ncbi:MAG: protein kinase domain-containing protein, partial [Thermoanaerobaculia bacterium]